MKKTIAIILLVMISVAGWAKKKDHLPVYYVEHAKSCYARGLWNPGYDTVRLGLEIYPKDPDLRYLAARYYYHKNNLERARFYALQAIKYDEEHIASKYLMVDIEERTGHISSAIGYVNDLLEAEQYDKDLWLRKIMLYRKQDNNEAADRMLRRLVQIYPEDLQLRKLLEQRRIEKYATNIRNGNLQEATKGIEELLVNDPTNLQYYIDLYQTYLRLGMKQRAIEVCNEGLNRCGKQFILLRAKVGIACEMGLFGEALDYLKGVQGDYPKKQLDPLYVDVLEQATRAKKEDDPYSMSADLYERTKNAEVREYLINAAIAKGDYDDATKYVNDALRENGDNKRMLLKRYTIERRLGKQATADEMIRDLYTQYPDDYDIANEFAGVLITKANNEIVDEDWNGAANHLEMALGIEQIDPGYRPLLETKLINAYGRQGQLTKAKQRCHTASEKYPEHRQQFASAYEAGAVRAIKEQMDEHLTRQALRTAEELVEEVPTSDAGMRYAASMADATADTAAFEEYVESGYRQYPNTPFYMVRHAELLRREGQYEEALSTVDPHQEGLEMQDDLVKSHSHISEEYALKLADSMQYEHAIRVVNEALKDDPANRSLKYTKGLILEKDRQLEDAYDYQKRYASPSIVELPSYMQHMKGLGYRCMRHSIMAEFLYAFEKDPLFTMASISYIHQFKKLTKDALTAQVSYKAMFAPSDEDSTAATMGMQLFAQWDHRFNAHWSGYANLSWSPALFNRWGANVSATYYFPHDWSTSLRAGYRRTAQDKNIYMVSPSVMKMWEHFMANAQFDLIEYSSQLFYNVSAKGKCFFNDDGVSSASVIVGFGSFPELNFFDMVPLEEIPHTNVNIGFNLTWLLSEHLSIGGYLDWYTYYDMHRSESAFSSSIRNIYNVGAMLKANF